MIEKKDVEKIAKLARLGISAKEEEKFEKDLSSVLEYFKMLETLDVLKVEPTFHATEDFFKEKENFMREDEEIPQAGKTVDDLIKASPAKEGRHVKVKSVF